MATAAKQRRLPGTEDPVIEELVEAAEHYVDIRDKRMSLTPKENELKTDLLNLMHKHHKKTYNHNGITIEIIAEEETVKVRVKKQEDEED
jgi:hypothetical protein